MKRTILFSLLFFVLFFSRAEGYDNLVIHPRLTEASIEIYNNQAGIKLDKEQAGWIIQGSVAEDADPRYLNHFYNPETGAGLSDGIFSGISAKEWAKNQSSYAGLTGDYSEGAILNNYRSGNLKRAYQGVGHMLHLIEDMAVPAHVRNDAHPKGDQYEKWAQQYGITSLNLAKYINVSGLNQAFDSLSSFTHDNFFSEDTINDNISFNVIRTEKDLDGDDVEYVYNGNYKIIKVIIHKSHNEYLFDFRVNLDYWNMLSPKAVGYSAGVVDYFVKRFSEIDKEKNKEKENFSIWEMSKDWTGSFALGVKDGLKYLTGDIVSAAGLNGQYAWAALKGATLDSWENVIFLSDAAREEVDKASAVSMKTAVNIGEKTVSAIKKADNRAKNLVSPKGAEASAKEVLGIKIENNNARTKAADAKTAVSDNKTGSNIKPGIIVEKNTALSEDMAITPMARIKAPDYEKGIEALPIPKKTGLIFIHAENNESNNDDIIIEAIPETSIISHPREISSSTEAFFKFSTTGNNFQFNLDSEGWHETGDELNLSGLGGGVHELKVRGVSGSGAINPMPEEFTWEVDVSAPEIILTSGPDQFTSSTGAIFLFSTAGENAEVKCALDGNSGENCSASSTFSGLSEGEHVFKITARDQAGNIGSTTHSWSIDLTRPEKPAIANIEPSTGVYWVNKNTMTLAGTKETGTDKIIIDGLEFAATSSESAWSLNYDFAFPCLEADKTKFLNCAIASGLPDSATNQEIIDFSHNLHAKRLKMKARDAAGNESDEMHYEFKIDFKNLSILAFGGTKSITGKKAYLASMDDENSVRNPYLLNSGIKAADIEMKFGEGDWAEAQYENYEDPFIQYMAQADIEGDYKFRLKVSDWAGNESAWSTEFSTKVAYYPVLSEVQLKKGAGSNDEFIELYNPTDREFELDGWSIQYRGGGSAGYVKKNFSSGDKIAPYGFFLIAHNDYTGAVLPDIRHSAFAMSADGGTIFLVSSTSILESPNGQSIVDKFAWYKKSGQTVFGEGSSVFIGSTGGSIERMATHNSTSGKMAAGGAHEFGGGGWDTDDTYYDWLERSAPDPQNTGSAPEEPVN